MAANYKAARYVADQDEARTDEPRAPGDQSGGEQNGPAQELIQEWRRVCALVAGEIGKPAYRSWIQPLRFAGASKGVVSIEAPSNFVGDWVRDHYADNLLAAWRGRRPDVAQVELRTAPGDSPLSAPAPTDSELAGEPGDAAAPDAQAHSATDSSKVDAAGGDDVASAVASIFGVTLDPHSTFEHFVVGKSNEFAYAAARRVAENAAVSFNPLFLYGVSGLGKTHLMQAIVWHIRQTQPGRKVLYLSAEKFMCEFVRALRFKDTMAFKEQFRSVDLLIVDDVQFFANKGSTQEEFFHTFNDLIDRNRQVIVSADRAPTELGAVGVQQRICSRLGWGLVADIHRADYELRLGILQSKLALARADHPSLQIPDAVLEFLGHKIESNVRDLEGALNRLIAEAVYVGGEINLDSAQRLLKDMLRAHDRRLSIEDIQTQVAEYFKMTVTELLSKRRSRAIVRPRQLAMYFCKRLTQASLPEIGRKFGGRDHTTVISALKRVEELLKTDAQFARDAEINERILTT
ncbi:MAG: chromosomal replication initiator protein DnaA [Pseudomonadota bacterium]